MRNMYKKADLKRAVLTSLLIVIIALATPAVTLLSMAMAQPIEDRELPEVVHPFLKAKFIESRQLKAKDRDDAVRRALNSEDVRNVVEISRMRFDGREALAVLHMLKVDDELITLLAVGIPRNDAALIYYELSKPIDGLKTQAMILMPVGEDEVRVIASSINRRIPRLMPRNKGSLSADGGIIASSNKECGGCVNIITGPWEYDCSNCVSWNLQCLIPCCGSCWTCIFAGPSVFLCFIICAGIWCPICLIVCCTTWVKACCPCPVA